MNIGDKVTLKDGMKGTVMTLPNNPRSPTEFVLKPENGGCAIFAYTEDIVE